MPSKKLTLSAVLVALSLALSLMERYVPLSLLVPLPGIKLGLANVVTLFALYSLGPLSAAAILLLRVLLGSIFGGSVTALLYALLGGMLSLLVMALARKIPFLSIYGVSVLGAAAHNIGQVAAACLLLGSVSAVSYLPLLLLCSTGTGLLVGLLTVSILRAVPSVQRPDHAS